MTRPPLRLRPDSNATAATMTDLARTAAGPIPTVGPLTGPQPPRGLVGGYDRCRPGDHCRGPVQLGQQHQMARGRSPEVEPPARGRRAAARPCRAVPGAVRLFRQCVCPGHRLPGLSHRTVPDSLRLRLFGLNGAVLPGSVGPGVPLQPRAAAGGAGAGTAGLQHGRGSAVGGRRAARRALHQDRYRAARDRLAADAHRLGRPGRAAGRRPSCPW